jgi:hypothetical protein
MKKLSVMSLSVEPDMQDLLKKHAKKKGVSVSKLVRDLVEKYLLNDDEVIPVILKVPTKLKENPQGLREWLDVKSSAIVKALAP